MYGPRTRYTQTIFWGSQNMTASVAVVVRAWGSWWLQVLCTFCVLSFAGETGEQGQRELVRLEVLLPCGGGCWTYMGCVIWNMKYVILKVELNVLQNWHINQAFHKVLVCRMLHGFTCLWHPMLAKSTFIHIALEDDLVDPVFFSLSCHSTRDEMESSCPATAL